MAKASVSHEIALQVIMCSRAGKYCLRDLYLKIACSNVVCVSQEAFLSLPTSQSSFHPRHKVAFSTQTLLHTSNMSTTAEEEGVVLKHGDDVRCRMMYQPTSHL